MNKLILIILILSTSGCISFKSKDEVLNISNITPSQEVIDKVDKILDKSVKFQRKSEKIALLKGRKLTKDEINYAVKLGIKNPDKIRIQYQWSFPEPKDKKLLYEFHSLGFGSFFEGGRTHGYGIFIKSYFPFQDSIIKHELVHVKQVEDMGLKQFTRQYLIEANTYDYFDMPLEKEAFDKTDGDNF